MAAAGVLAATATGLAAVAGASAGTRHPWALAAGFAAIVGIPAVVGVATWARRPGDRFAPALAVAGGGWLVIILLRAPDADGQPVGWLVSVLVAYLLLSFPTGRLPRRADRLLIQAMACAVPVLALVERLTPDGPAQRCAGDCAAGVLGAGETGGGLLSASSEIFVLAVTIAVGARLWRTLAISSPVARRALRPALEIAMVSAAMLALGLFVWRDASAVAWTLALTPAALALAYLVFVLRSELLAGRALARLARRVEAGPDARSLERAFRDAFADPSMELSFAIGDVEDGQWLGARAGAAQRPVAAEGRAVHVAASGEAVVAAITYDAALGTSPATLDAACAMAAVALDNQRLSAQADAASREVLRSRARLLTVSERERRRIARDLHDGAQQRIVAVRIELELAEDLLRGDAPEAAARIRALEGALDEALDELRSLAHGVYPPLLADHGLHDALRAAVRHSPVRVRLDVSRLGRYDPAVEGAVYFCVLEALQNVAKHARSAHRAVVVLDGTVAGELRFSVRDDGAGAADLRPGAGLTNMRDRLSALGGAVEITSVPRVGTAVRGSVPARVQPGVTP